MAGVKEVKKLNNGQRRALAKMRDMAFDALIAQVSRNLEAERLRIQADVFHELGIDEDLQTYIDLKEQMDVITQRLRHKGVVVGYDNKPRLIAYERGRVDKGKAPELIEDIFSGVKDIRPELRRQREKMLEAIWKAETVDEIPYMPTIADL